MNSERITQLLDIWMTDRQRGISRSIAELCAECPDLEPEVSRRIKVLSRFEKLADMGSSETLVSQGEIDTSHSTDERAPVTTRKLTSMPASIGGFIPIEILGEGGMGAVYLAEDRQLGRRVAVKVMKKELAADPDAKRRFLREARAMATIEHDNIMTIYAVGEDQETPFLVMPVLKGETLDDRLRRETKLSVAESCRISREIADGLAAAHAHGLIHRDIKPSNIWLEGKQGRVRILDFGLARPATDDQRVTQSGTVLGTPAYMAPEQAAGTDATPRSDLFSLGAVMYRMTTGTQPFSGPNMMATLNNLANKRPEPPHKSCPEVPEELSLLIERLIAKSPEQRPQSADSVMEALQQTSETLAPGATTAALPSEKARVVKQAAVLPVAGPSSVIRPPGSSRKLLAGGFAGFLMLLAVVVYRIQTDNGTLIVSIDDEQVAAKLSKNGLVIEDAKTGRKWTLTANETKPMPPGDYKLPQIEGLLLDVKDDSGTEFTTSEFKIKRGDQITVRVTLVPDPVLQQKAAEMAKVKAPVVATGHSPFDDLDPARIPKEERTAELPPEVVAVLGSSHGKTWGSVFSQTHGNMAYSPDGKWIAACDISNAYLFDANTLDLRKRFPLAGHFLCSRWATFSTDSSQLHVVMNNSTGIHRNTVTDLTTADLKTSVAFEDIPSTVVAISPDNQWMATEAPHPSDWNVQLWHRDPATGGVSEKQRVPDAEGLPPTSTLGRVVELAFSPDGEWLISGHSTGSSGGYSIFRKQNGSFVHVAVIPANVNQYNVRVAYSFTEDHKIAVLDGADFVQQVDLSLPMDLPLPSAGLPVNKVEALTGVHDISVSADGLTWAASRNVYQSSPGILVGTWRDGNPVLKHTIPLHVTAVGHVALSPRGESLAVMAEQRIIGIYDLTQSTPVAITLPEYSYSAVSTSAKNAVTVGMSGTIKLERVSKEGAELLDTQTTEHPMVHVCISNDGRRAVSFSPPNAEIGGQTRIQVWDIDDGNLVAGPHFNAPADQAWSWPFLLENGSQLLYGNSIWDLENTPPKILHTFSGMPGKPSAAAVSQDNQTVALVDGNGILSLFQLTETAEVPIASVQLPPLTTAIAFSPDGRHLVTTHTAAIGVVWELKEDQITEQARMPAFYLDGFGGMYHPTTSVFSSDGGSVFVGGQNGVVEWKLDDNSIERHWKLPGFTWLSRSADGRHLIFNNSNTTTWILRLTP